MNNNLISIMTVVCIVIVYMTHKAVVDIKMFSQQEKQKWIREKFWYFVGDAMYLAGTAITMIALGYSCWNAGHTGVSLLQFTFSFFLGLLIGSEIWDLLFGYVIYQDVFYPFPNWAFKWGFKTKFDRIIFDFVRMASAVFIVFLLNWSLQ